jgi:hypothetical protein
MLAFLLRMSLACATSAGQLVCASASGLSVATMAALITTAKNFLMISFLPLG